MYTQQDRVILKQLAQRVHEIAQLPEQQKKRDLWRKHTALKHGVPLLFVSPEGSWDEILPWESLKCEDGVAQEVEMELRQRIYRYEHIHDDTPIEDHYDFSATWIPYDDDWGIPFERRPSTEERGSWHHIPAVEDPADWKKLRMPSLDVDMDRAQARARELQDTVGDALQVHAVGCKLFDFHLAHMYCNFRGLNNLFIDLVDEPEMVKDVFAFFTEGMQKMVKEAQDMHLPQSNNDYTYHYTGGLGYCDDLPAYRDGEVPLNALWGAAESQEYSCVSPDMFYETVLPFEKKLLEPYGLNGYGCCDDLTYKLDGVLEIKNLRRVAACPWADLGKMAARLKKDYIMTWKPNPAYLAGEYFDEAAVEKYMTESLEAAKAGYPEIILRDTHSCRNDPKRFTQFVQLTRRAIEKVYNL